MLRHNVPVRRDLDQIAADNGFDFHIIDNEIYWDESRAYRFTLRQIEEQIENRLRNCIRCALRWWIARLKTKRS
ncbi:hypothetical protein FA041_28275 [Escherichia coli]|nr:hypothetical protein [Escherichia coli]